MENDKRKKFYEECAQILNVEHEYKDTRPTIRYSRRTGESYTPSTQATRWGGREPGNGRFGKYGIIRYFSADCIHMALNDPPVFKTFESTEEALEFLKNSLEILED